MAEVLTLPQRALITGRQLAERLGVSYFTVKYWSCHGKLTDLQIHVGGSIKYDPEQIEREIRSGRFAVKAA